MLRKFEARCAWQGTIAVEVVAVDGNHTRQRGRIHSSQS
jgi:hypothetical protein